MHTPGPFQQKQCFTFLFFFGIQGQAFLKNFEVFSLNFTVLLDKPSYVSC